MARKKPLPVLKQYFGFLDLDEYIYLTNKISDAPTYCPVSEETEIISYPEECYEFGDNESIHTFFVEAYTLEEAKKIIIDEFTRKQNFIEVDNEYKYSWALEALCNLFNRYIYDGDDYIIYFLKTNNYDLNYVDEFINFFKNFELKYYPKIKRQEIDLCSIVVNDIEYENLDEEDQKFISSLSNEILFKLYQFSFELNILVYPIREIIKKA